jgi:hypothetical protein
VSLGLSRPECSEAEAEKRGLSPVACGESMLKDCAAAEKRGLSRADCNALGSGGRELFGSTCLQRRFWPICTNS